MRTGWRGLFIPIVLLTSTYCTSSPASTTPSPAIGSETIPTALTTIVPTVTQTPAYGAISGYLLYPGEFIPELRVVAFDSKNADIYYYVDTVQNQKSYRIENIPAGIYHVVAYVLDPASHQAGGYSQAVLCGMQAGCADHTLLDVIVTGGTVTEHVNPSDWFAPAGVFPPRPVQ